MCEISCNSFHLSGSKIGKMDQDIERTNERNLTQLTDNGINGTDDPIEGEIISINLENPSKTVTNDATPAAEKEPNIEDLLSSNTIPWHNLAKYGNQCVNSFARKLGNFFQKLIYSWQVLLLIFAFYFHYSVLTLNNVFYKSAYEPSSCTYYYAFDYENFTHHLRNSNKIENLTNKTNPLETTTEYSNNTTDFNIDCLYVNPIYFTFICFYNYCIPTFLCLAWFYTVDRRFGALNLKHSDTTRKLRKHSLIIQIPIIVLLIPINIIIAFMFGILFIPIIVIIVILNWICKCGC